MVDSRVEGVMMVNGVVVPLKMRDPGVDLRGEHGREVVRGVDEGC